MEKAREALKILESTLNKYHLNKTKISPEDLEGKYRNAFWRLKEKLRAETESYLSTYCFSGFKVRYDDSDKLVAAIDRSIKENQIAKRAGRAVFQNFNLEELQEIAKEQRKRVEALYAEYFNRHTYLYVSKDCWESDNPQNPLIYNDLVDKFWDEGTETWIDEKKLPEGTVLIISSKRMEN